jgi:hypothetical protein
MVLGIVEDDAGDGGGLSGGVVGMIGLCEGFLIQRVLALAGTLLIAPVFSTT